MLPHGMANMDKDIKALFAKLHYMNPLEMFTYKVDRMLGRVAPILVYDHLKLFIHEGHEMSLYTYLGQLNATNMKKDYFAELGS